MFEDIDGNINMAVDRLDLNLLNDLMDNRDRLMKRCMDEHGKGELGDEEFIRLIDDVRHRGALIQARLSEKLRLVKKELKRMEAEREVRNGYLIGGGYGTE